MFVSVAFTLIKIFFCRYQKLFKLLIINFKVEQIGRKSPAQVEQFSEYGAKIIPAFVI